MIKHRFTFAEIQAMPRPAGYLQELLEIATDHGEDWLELDLESPGYFALRKKYQSMVRSADAGASPSLAPARKRCCT